MAMLLGPQPQLGRIDHVTLDDKHLQLVEGTYAVQESERLGQKISTGDLRYADFNPYESAEALTSFAGGYGVGRYSEIHPFDLPPEQARTMYREAANVDARHGYATLAPLQTAETLPGSTAPVVWLGEFTPAGGSPTWVAVAGTQVFTRNGAGVWADTGITLAASARQGAVAVFGSQLLIGYGGDAVAQFTANLSSVANCTTAAPANAYIYALTTDRAAIYAAASATSTTAHTVMAGTSATTFDQTSIIPCGSAHSAITSLAPGGGLVLVYVGKETELGAIDTTAIYRTLLPYDSKASTNSGGLRWMLASGGEGQRGPLALVFVRDRSYWLYVPAAAHAGEAQNLAPWAADYLHPPNIRGRARAFQGTARWLFVAITSDAGATYVLARDSRTGATHSLHSVGSHACTALGVTALFGPNPLLFIGRGNHVASVILPLDGEEPLEDPACRFEAAGTLDTGDLDLNLPTEPKVAFTVQVVADGLVADAQEIVVSYALDGATSWTLLGQATTSPLSEIVFDAPLPTPKRIALRAAFSTTSSSSTPVLHALVLRCSLNSKLYRQWVFEASVPTGDHALPGLDTQNPYTVITELWATRRAGVPVVFTDRWGDRYDVRILRMAEREVYREPFGTPENRLRLDLLETGVAANPTILETYLPAATTATFLPFTVPWSNVYNGTISATDTVVNTGGDVVYPRWTITGPGETLVLTNTTTGEVFTWAATLAAGEVLTIDMRPTKQTVVNGDGVDRASAVVSGSVYWGFAAAAPNTLSVFLGGTARGSIVQLAHTAL
jgi:hypothetical protein